MKNSVCWLPYGTMTLPLATGVRVSCLLVDVAAFRSLSPEGRPAGRMTLRADAVIPCRWRES
ncbi:hypothetical protein KCP75_16560 [Salmonella enterica subsp. enterica]|nr:hypothetical protein KCP75_16560 [Salmonella enterica subsp. enterica]